MKGGLGLRRPTKDLRGLVPSYENYFLSDSINSIAFSANRLPNST